MHHVICMGCDQELKVKLPIFGVETFDCPCGYMVIVERGKNKYEVDHCNENGNPILHNIHYINKKVVRDEK